MRSGGIHRVRQAIKNMQLGEKRLLFGHLVKAWHLTVSDYCPSAAIFGYNPTKPLAGYLDHLLVEERQQIMRELCQELGKSLPDGIEAEPETLSLATG